MNTLNIYYRLIEKNVIQIRIKRVHFFIYKNIYDTFSYEFIYLILKQYGSILFYFQFKILVILVTLLSNNLMTNLDT